MDAATFGVEADLDTASSVPVVVLRETPIDPDQSGPAMSAVGLAGLLTGSGLISADPLERAEWLAAFFEDVAAWLSEGRTE